MDIMNNEEKNTTPATKLEPTNSLAHGGPFLTGFLVNTALGYVLYFITLALPEPPAWALGVIEYLKPTIKVLDTAARLNDRPFAAQVTILYAAFSAVPLAAYFLYLAFFVKKIRQAFRRRLHERMQELGGPTVKLRLKLVGAGAITLFFPAVVFPMIFSFHWPPIGRVVVSSFSTSIFSASILLLMSGLAAFSFITGLAVIQMILTYDTSDSKSKEQTRS